MSASLALALALTACGGPPAAPAAPPSEASMPEPKPAPAADPLISAASSPDAAARTNAIYALGERKNPEDAPVFVKALNDSDERVRAEAARGLAKIGHPDALSAALRVLDDGADLLHNDMTPSVQTLGELGLPAVPPLLDLLLSDKQMTRLHAQRALEGIINRQNGFVPGQGFPGPHAEESALGVWKANGNYAYDAPEADRKAAVEKWRAWLAGQKG